MKLKLSRFNPKIQRTEYLHLCPNVPDVLVHTELGMPVDADMVEGV